MIRLTDLNAAGGIGANSFLLEVGPFRLLLDSGMHPKEVGHPSLPRFEHCQDGGLDAIILTHCHLDHLGALPVATRHHPETKILTTPASCLLGPRMLRNSVNVMKRQREELDLPELPLYTMRDIVRVESALQPLFFGRTIEWWKGAETLEITLHPSGHIAGAASVEIGYRHQRLLCSGDILFDRQRTVDGAVTPRGRFDHLLLETTRGATERPPGQTRSTELARFWEIAADTIRGGGSLLVPVFALGRMQEMMALLVDAFREGLVPVCPVYATGLGMDLVNYLHKIGKREHTVHFARHVLTRLKVRPLPDPLRPGREPGEPGIFLLSSGMMVPHTPSYKMAASLLGKDRNTIAFIGYCDPDTPGAELQRTPRGEEFLFEAMDYSCPVEARVERFDISGHADRDELVDYARAIDPRTVVLQHGDQEARDWFQETLTPDFPEVIDPTPLQPIQLAG